MEEKQLLSAVVLSAHDISSSPVDLGAGTRIGFTGTATFRLHGRQTPTAQQQFAALSLFATIAGAGAQTTHGLGTVDITLE